MSFDHAATPLLLLVVESLVLHIVKDRESSGGPPLSFSRDEDGREILSLEQVSFPVVAVETPASLQQHATQGIYMKAGVPSPTALGDTQLRTDTSMHIAGGFNVTNVVAVAAFGANPALRAVEAAPRPPVRRMPFGAVVAVVAVGCRCYCSCCCCCCRSRCGTGSDRYYGIVWLEVPVPSLPCALRSRLALPLCVVV